MSYTQIVRSLARYADSAAETDKRHIIHFINRREYKKFIQQWTQSHPTRRLRSAVRKLQLINSVCFQGTALPALRHRGIRLIEEDCRIHMQGIHRSVRQGNGSAFRKTDASASIPWGVRRVRAPQAWKKSVGARVKVAVIDTGVDYHHPDLKSVLAPGLNMLRPGTVPWDDNGHGTHIIGTLAAAGGSGLWGTAPRAIIYPIKAFDRNGSAYVSDIIQGLEWCVRSGIRLVNMSFGMTSSSRAFQQAVKTACDKGTILVASAGNDGKSVLDYPAHYASTIAVGATNRRGSVARFSNRTSRVHIYAPGQSIPSTWLRKGYAELSGTSMATSHVSGALALALALRPGLSPRKIKDLLRRTGRPLKGKYARTLKEVDALRLVHAVLRL